MKGVGLQELNCLKVKLEEGGEGSVLESTEDSGLGAVWILVIISGITFAISLAIDLAIDLAMREANFLLEVELLAELESRRPGLYNILNTFEE